MAISADEAAYQTAHIHENKGVNILVAESILSALSTLAIFLRIYVRWSTRLGFKADDYTIVAAGVSINQILFGLNFELEKDNSLAQICCRLPRYISPPFSRQDCSSLMAKEVSNGMGRHLIAVSEHQLSIIFKVRTWTDDIRSSPNLTCNSFCSQGLLFDGPGFHLSIALIQLSFLFLYKRIFTTQRTWFKYTIYALGVFSIIQNLAIIITVMFYCVPFNYSWNKSIKGGHCYEFSVVYLIGLLLNLVTDIAILVVPIPIIWGLQMSPKSKKAITGMFLLGGL